MVKEKWDGKKVEEVFHDTLGLFIYIKLKVQKFFPRVDHINSGYSLREAKAYRQNYETIKVIKP